MGKQLEIEEPIRPGVRRKKCRLVSPAEAMKKRRKALMDAGYRQATVWIQEDAKKELKRRAENEGTTLLELMGRILEDGAKG